MCDMAIVAEKNNNTDKGRVTLLIIEALWKVLTKEFF
jgi:hypothetical protein